VRVAADSVGSATLTLAAPGGVNLSIKVKVVAKPVTVEAVTITRKKTSMAPNAVTMARARVSPGDATGAVIRWTSSTPKVATVEADGRVVARAAGKTVITAQAGAKKAKFTLRVK
jgi:uncharacterized protein YjdB